MCFQIVSYYQNSVFYVRKRCFRPSKSSCFFVFRSIISSISAREDTKVIAKSLKKWAIIIKNLPIFQIYCHLQGYCHNNQPIDLQEEKCFSGSIGANSTKFIMRDESILRFQPLSVYDLSGRFMTHHQMQRYT